MIIRHVPPGLYLWTAWNYSECADGTGWGESAGYWGHGINYGYGGNGFGCGIKEHADAYYSRGELDDVY